MKIEDRLKSAGREVRDRVEQMAITPAAAVRRKNHRRRRASLLAAIGTVVVALAGAGVVMASRPADQNPPDAQNLASLPSLETAPPSEEGQFDPIRIQAIRVSLIEEAMDRLDLDPPPTQEEIDEAARRNRIQADATPTVVRGLIGDKAYAGQWFDSATGTLFVGITTALDQEDAIAALASLEADPAIVVFTYSYDDLQGFYDELVRRMPEDARIGLYVDQNRIGIAINDPSAIDISGIPEDAIFFEPYTGPAQLGVLDDDGN